MAKSAKKIKMCSFMLTLNPSIQERVLKSFTNNSTSFNSILFKFHIILLKMLQTLFTTINQDISAYKFLWDDKR